MNFLEPKPTIRSDAPRLTWERRNPQLYTLNPTPSILHPTTYTLNPTPYTLHPQSYTLNPTARQFLQVAFPPAMPPTQLLAGDEKVILIAARKKPR